MSAKWSAQSSFISSCAFFFSLFSKMIGISTQSTEAVLVSASIDIAPDDVFVYLNSSWTTSDQY